MIKKHSEKFPWLSIIIPAHNCSTTIERLLDSIIAQNDNDMEVIICDDNSTDNFMEKVEPYKKNLNIVYCKTKPREIHCPGNTRFDGWHNAVGEWITFIDHDDVFEPDTFREIKRHIEETEEDKLIYTTFRDFMESENRYMKTFDGATWMHGKFYNRYWLMREDIDFEENLYTHEDLYFNGRVLSTIIGQGNHYHKIENLFVYKWIYKEDSMSRSYTKLEHSFIETHFKDYLYAAVDPWMKSYERYPSAKDFFFKQMCSVLLYAYFYYQGFLYSKGFKNILKDNIYYYQEAVHRICNGFNKTKDDIVKMIYSDFMMYDKIKHDAEIGNCNFVEVVSFLDFIRNM